MCRSRLLALYCVRTRMRRSSLLMQLERVKSMMRYRPPKGTAGLARSRVSGSRRVPLPPARIKVRTSFTGACLLRATPVIVLKNAAHATLKSGGALFVHIPDVSRHFRYREFSKHAQSTRVTHFLAPAVVLQQA